MNKLEGMALVAAIAALFMSGSATAQMGGMGGMGGGMGGGGRGGPPPVPEDSSASPHEEKPDIAARKAYKAGAKALDKARALADQALQATDPDKKARLEEKAGDQYGRALDAFTEALSNRGDMVEAWNGAGYVWNPGHYVAIAPGTRWEPPHWAWRGGAWVWLPGHWS